MADSLIQSPVEMSKWNITNNTNWNKYQAAINDNFISFNTDSFHSVDEI
jgi:hypothetical protein